MQEPYDEELAIYIDLELCTLIRKDWGEALTKACAGWVLSLEKILIQGADVVQILRKATFDTSFEARCIETLRGRRPHARTETPHARTGRPCFCPFIWAAS